MNTLSVFIHPPAEGIALRRLGISARTTNGAAMVAPNTPMPITIRITPPLAPAAISVPTKGPVQVKLVITRVRPMRKTP